MNKRDIYKSIILDNSLKPNNLVKSSPKGYDVFDAALTGSCSDEYQLYLNVKDKAINDIKFSGSGCAISKSSINILANQLNNKTIEFSIKHIENYKKLIMTGKPSDGLGDLIAFEGVHRQLNRINCALIGANSLLKMLEKYE